MEALDLLEQNVFLAKNIKMCIGTSKIETRHS
jgi:hypothetical protein